MCKLVLIGVLLLASFGACAEEETMTLEKDDVQFLKVTPLPDEGAPSRIMVSGLAFHSGLAVSTHTLERRGNEIDLIVTLVPARDGLSGSFEIPVDVGDDVEVVRFGAKKELIWRR